jgi:hypothetical protein
MKSNVTNSCFAVLVCVLFSVSAASQAPREAAAAAVVPVTGKLLVAADGAPLGSVYRVGPDGSAQIIIEGRMVTIPAGTFSSVDGKLTTSLTKRQVNALR